MTDEAPFDEEHQLYHELRIGDAQILHQPLEGHPHNAPGSAKTYLPGDPRLQFTDSEIGNRLITEYITEDLDKLAPHLWLMTTQSSANIASLTEQMVRGRRIVISENPGLHLVWVNDRIFLKPLPEYLLSHAFWKHFLLSNKSPIDGSTRIEILRAARGFVRSYAYLIQHKSDFVLATREDTALIPKDISFANFIRCMEQCRGVEDKLVSPRYQFGELRLTRLNFWITIFLFKPHYQLVEWQYGAYFAQYYAPIIFIFAVFSLLLSSMQVVLAAQPVLGDDGRTLTAAAWPGLTYPVIKNQAPTPA
ncbi:hypothetical protein O1611_g3207 [Lasiodiplodia mahajangana]|uniref:Uncharacterized protein n=1 Tax=Lasiodiplodia mahajangana TaxID=1108764 RepID=A0ACC2JSF9_9PEZI|nr:hypothetical protein O1611_g3207 [Lasiodiplodia mahajangana]